MRTSGPAFRLLLLAVLTLFSAFAPAAHYSFSVQCGDREAKGRTFNNSNQRTNTGYVYDGNGNATTHGGTGATYDEENRMLTYGSATYTYRADGLRASDGTGSSKKYYLYDGGNAVCRLSSTGTLDRTYVFAPDGLVGWSIPGSTSHQMLFDWQGNLEHSTTPSGNVATSHAYNAWGQRNSVFPINAVTGANDRFGYNARWGYVRDTTGLYYCQNRYYDPANGRWLNRDPIGYAGGMNLYGYCGGGPVGGADPSGLESDKVVAEAMLAADANPGSLALQKAADRALASFQDKLITAGTVANSPVGRVATGAAATAASRAQQSASICSKVGETIYTQSGKWWHSVLSRSLSKLGENGYKVILNSRLPSGLKPDAVIRGRRFIHVVEIASDNPAKFNSKMWQLYQYVHELQALNPRMKVTGELLLYPRGSSPLFEPL